MTHAQLEGRITLLRLNIKIKEAVIKYHEKQMLDAMMAQRKQQEELELAEAELDAMEYVKGAK